MEFIQLGSLWKSDDGKTHVMSGNINHGTAVYIFPNKNKTGNQPDFSLCITKKEKKDFVKKDENPF